MKSESTGSELLQRLLHGEAAAADVVALVSRAETDPGFARVIAGELAFSSMLGEAVRSGAPVVDAGAHFESNLRSAALPMDDLLARVREGSATGYECDQVVKHLWDSPAAAAQLRRDLAMEEFFHEALLDSKSESAFVRSLETRMWAETRRDHFVDDFAKRLERELTSAVEEVEDGKVVPFAGGWGYTFVKMGAVAAVLALGSFFGVQTMLDHKTAKPTLASVVKTSAGVTWSGEAVPGEDGSIRSGLYRLATGVVSMRMSTGSELTVEGPAIFEVGDDASTFVHEGIALARLSSTDPGISLRSKGLSVAEPARLIGIDARSEGATEAIVFNGDGGICLTEGGKCRELSEFEAVKADHLRERLVDVPYNPKAFANAWALLSGVENNLGSVRIEMPGAAISSGQGLEGEVQVYVENESFRPASDLEVDQVVAGEFSVAEANPGQQLQAKGELRSYLLQLWPTEAGEGDEVETSLTFDHPVVGVIFSSDRLVSSDSSVGSTISDASPGFNSNRGMDSGNDEILLSQDRRTLNLRFKGGGAQAGQVRVLVALN
jgi:hypothetical protein